MSELSIDRTLLLLILIVVFFRTAWPRFSMKVWLALVESSEIVKASLTLL